MLIFYTMGIAEALHNVREKIVNAAVKAGRSPDEIKLVAVSKTVDIKSIKEAVRSGVSILGENKVQEAVGKITEFRATSPFIQGVIGGVEWHFIGNLQKNKAKTAVGLFDLIHSVDSVSLAEELNRCSGSMNKVQRVLVQVKLSDETAKHGIKEEEVIGLLEKVSKMDYLRLDGLMTIPPFSEDSELARPYFIRLRRLAEKARTRGFNIAHLSMGMSNDFEVAIEEGATMVRVGSAIFGERNY
ncbi:MAG: YggS family pyridoxal phosphate-dependent enzyme [Thermodesulfovibrionia bacterium]|nr:YggS family pyridoxal phosphate-dependent enzyme [Thermodesulfovibrionia bacterium]